MSEKVDRCKHFLKTGLQKKVPFYKECTVCPLRNAKGDCISDIFNDGCLNMEEQVSDIWRDYFAKRPSKQP